MTVCYVSANLCMVLPLMFGKKSIAMMILFCELWMRTFENKDHTVGFWGLSPRVWSGLCITIMAKKVFHVG